MSDQVHALLDPGSEHSSPGGQYSFRVLGPCCRLFDREELPWPCCRLAWRSKEPSWRRIGRRFVADLAARRCPSYVVELLQPGSRPTRTVLTLFPQRLVVQPPARLPGAGKRASPRASSGGPGGPGGPAVGLIVLAFSPRCLRCAVDRWASMGAQIGGHKKTGPWRVRLGKGGGPAQPAADQK
jgi:hypothetical protein